MAESSNPSNPGGGTGTQLLPAKSSNAQTKMAPLYHIILHDDQQHTYDYVIVMLMQLFGKDQASAFQHAREVDQAGASVVETTTLERAELKRDQIRAFGRDPLIKTSSGSMCATIEPAD
jgi:ATP-dependent Clp protease adaptor protein ClpS